MQTQKQKYYRILKQIGMYETLLKNYSKEIRFTLLIITFVVTLCATLAYNKKTPLITLEVTLIIIIACMGVCAILSLYLPKYSLWIKRKGIVKKLKKQGSHPTESITTLEYLAER